MGPIDGNWPVVTNPCVCLSKLSSRVKILLFIEEQIVY